MEKIINSRIGMKPLIVEFMLLKFECLDGFILKQRRTFIKMKTCLILYRVYNIFDICLKQEFTK